MIWGRAPVLTRRASSWSSSGVRASAAPPGCTSRSATASMTCAKAIRSAPFRRGRKPRLERIPLGLADEALALAEARKTARDGRERAVAVEHAQYFLHRQHRGLQRGVRVEHETEAHGGKLALRGDRRLAAHDHVGDLGHAEATRNLHELGPALGRLHESRVGTGLGIALRAGDRGLEPLD